VNSMTKTPQNITIIGAGINGLVAANYLARAGHKVTLLERKDWVGGACVSETVEVDGIRQDYPLGATVLGLMQDYLGTAAAESGVLSWHRAASTDLPRYIAITPGICRPMGRTR